MNIGVNFWLALKSLATSKMRAFLTMLGIIIGVAAVIIIMSLGSGMQNMMTEAFEELGTNTISVSLMGRGSSRTVTVNDMYELAEENPDSIRCVSPTVVVNGTVKANGDDYSNSTITGVGEDYLTIKSHKLDSGRFLEYIDVAYRKNVCVVGKFYDSETVFDGDALGQTIKINGTKFTIIGVVEGHSDDPSDEYLGDNYIYIPYSNAQKMSLMGSINSYTVLSLNENTVDKAKAAVESKLTKIYGSSDYYVVISMAEMLDSLTAITSTFVLVLAAIAGISLLVGGIGIMNIMLVSVTERTREIGIRKALGAKQSSIKSQFVIEAATTSAIGGVIGVILGILIADFAGGLLDIKSAPTVGAIAVSFGISVGIGILFGFLPANKAAKLNPIDALRND